jgi:hypothetical protein
MVPGAVPGLSAYNGGAKSKFRGRSLYVDEYCTSLVRYQGYPCTVPVRAVKLEISFGMAFGSCVVLTVDRRTSKFSSISFDGFDCSSIVLR